MYCEKKIYMGKGGGEVKLKINWTGLYSSYQGYQDIDTWNSYVYLSRCYEPSNKKLVIWQVKFLWIVVSVWWQSQTEYIIKQKKEAGR